MELKLNTQRIYKCFYMVSVIITLFTVIFTFYDSNHFYGLEKIENNLYEKIFNRLYFTITTLSSANYGDIVPKSREVKIITMFLQTIIILGVMIIFI